jgi:hypothetical protein
MGELDRAIAAVAAVDRRSIREGRVGSSSPARLLAITLAIELRVAPANTIAAYYGLASSQSVRTLARRGRALASDDEHFGRLRSRVLHRVGNDH